MEPRPTPRLTDNKESDGFDHPRPPDLAASKVRLLKELAQWKNARTRIERAKKSAA